MNSCCCSFPGFSSPFRFFQLAAIVRTEIFRSDAEKGWLLSGPFTCMFFQTPFYKVRKQTFSQIVFPAFHTGEKDRLQSFHSYDFSRSALQGFCVVFLDFLPDAFNPIADSLLRNVEHLRNLRLCEAVHVIQLIYLPLFL